MTEISFKYNIFALAQKQLDSGRLRGRVYFGLPVLGGV